MNASQIQNDFISRLRQAGEDKDFQCRRYQGTRRMSRSIIELSGSINCLIYFKVRYEKPYRWGVTANRIRELEQAGKKWVLILLYESPDNGYLITDREVKRYLSIWPLGSDGDYKVGPGSCLQFNRPFHSFVEFINSLLRD